MEDRQSRLFLALILSMGIWMGVNYFFFPSAPNKTSETKKTNLDKPSDKKQDQVQTKEKKESLPSKEIKRIPSENKKTLVVTESYVVELSSLGGRISKFYVKDFTAPSGELVQVARKDPETLTVDGKTYYGVELSREKGFDFNFTDSLNELPDSEWNRISFSLEENKTDRSVVFSAFSPDKTYQLKKTFRFFNGENYFKVTVSVVNLTREKLSFASQKNTQYLRTFGSLGPFPKDRPLNDRDTANFFRFYHLGGSFNDTLDGSSSVGFWSSIGNFFTGNSGADESFSLKTSTEGVDFAGTGSRYFIAVADPLDHKPQGIVLDNRPKNESGAVLVYNNITLGPGEVYDLDFASYVGIRESIGMVFHDPELDPNQTKNSPFAGLSSDLGKSFNQGMTAPFRNGIIWVLKQIYRFTIPNYGWSIIIFAILFKLVFYPLNQKQADSMKKMQELGPQLKTINEKFANDPKIRQQKTMELYKKNNVNPVGGCLPMVIQIPIFIALYSAFSDTIDLWNSPFLWVKDLSEPDVIWTSPAIPYFTQTGIGLNLLALLMVGTQIFQTRMTSVSMDPNQKMLMYVMPVMMLYIFWNMPSGVTLYWTFQNILSIGQQWITNHLKKTEEKKKTA
ncbi:membrane protein insertase YidC [Leptospira santarosai]|uniref:Membrane protein insertase YidC n=1 Tax=Leptospira santarosai str. MOR084 TaxID=1049984 RepID=A0A0E2BGF2_9LEPT|nr:membrane protein insertase YidC [Leptospira santarosai]ASV13014.1 preprotein translocase YidC [Leptospira santarosai]EKO34423.1 60Kd inner membrane protein [Leptospira santarosai str. MOR084]EKR90944.1 60Kd inner membrane protein [Leptospira santarosai str. CBC379]EMJ47172.1 60Kd inner membrane protein [Leptospira santarosai str. HAI1349]EMO21916.1 60Kd inner membrane protein [Leptospira santarosai str. HAI134]